MNPILAFLVLLGDRLFFSDCSNQPCLALSIRVTTFLVFLLIFISILKLHSAADDVIDGVVCIFKALIFKQKSSGSSLTDTGEVDVVLPLLIHLLDERDGTARAVVVLVAEYCLMYFPSSILSIFFVLDKSNL